MTLFLDSTLAYDISNREATWLSYLS